MLTMKNFHELLNTPSTSRDAYMDAVAHLTTLDRSQLSALSSDLAWQTWGEGSMEITKA